MYIYGICSNIPFSFHEHYLLVDVDRKKEIQKCLAFMAKREIRPSFLEETPNGYHVYCLQRFKFEELVAFMPLIPAIDKLWFQIGLNRGYWFLWTRSPFPVTVEPVSFMRLSVPAKNVWFNTKRPIGWMKNLNVKK